MNGPPERAEGPAPHRTLDQSTNPGRQDNSTPKTATPSCDRSGLHPGETIAHTISTHGWWVRRLGSDNKGRETWDREPVVAFVVIEGGNGRRIEALTPDYFEPELRTVSSMARDFDRETSEYELVCTGQHVCHCAQSWNAADVNWCRRCGGDIVIGDGE